MQSSKKFFSIFESFLIMGLFFFMLFTSKIVFTGAAKGIDLWFHHIFPTMFPYIFFSNLMIESGCFQLLCRLIGKLLCPLFSISYNGCYVMITGFLCGCPMGAKATADLLRHGYIPQGEGQYLLSFCNNISPAFIVNYIVMQTFKDATLIGPTLMILYGVPLIFSFFSRRFHKRNHHTDSLQKETVSSSSIWDIMDSSLMNSIHSIVMIGAYMIIFSVFISLMNVNFSHFPLMKYIVSTLEISNGVQIVKNNCKLLKLCYPWIMGLTAFGGFCALMQTKSMTKECGLSMKIYCIEKLTATIAVSLISYLYINYLY